MSLKKVANLQTKLMTQTPQVSCGSKMILKYLEAPVQDTNRSLKRKKLRKIDFQKFTKVLIKSFGWATIKTSQATGELT